MLYIYSWIVRLKTFQLCVLFARLVALTKFCTRARAHQLKNVALALCTHLKETKIGKFVKIRLFFLATKYQEISFNQIIVSIVSEVDPINLRKIREK
jgi:hypothetical protein